MKSKLLLLLIFLLGTFFSQSQTELVVTAPETGATTGLRAPNGTTAHTTVRGVIIITPAELAAIPTGTVITKLNMLLETGAIPGPSGGNIEFYLENTTDVTNLKSTTWSTCISTMTSVYSGAYDIPAVAGSTAPLTLTSNFVYNGGSVYVAYDYTGSVFTTFSSVYHANNTLAGGWKGMVSTSTISPTTLTQTSAFRPCIQFTFSNPYTNELNVSGLAGEKGIFNSNLKTTQTVTSTITNTSVGALTNIPVTLDVTGANPYTVMQTIASIAPGATDTILFINVPTSNTGSQVISVSLPADENVANNTAIFNQQVQCDSIGYNQGPVQGSGVGFNTGTGVIAVRHEITSSQPTFVKEVTNYFSVSANNTGNTIKGLLLDASGTIIDSTNLITITAAMLGTKQEFSFLNGNVDVSNDTIYVGFRQTANIFTGYFPFGNQNNSYVDGNAAATFPVNGGAPTPLGDALGYMMFNATLDFDGFDVPNSSFNGVICTNSILDITPMTGFSNYEFFIDGVSVQDGATPTYSTAPLTASTDFSVTITNGACTFSSDVIQITVPPLTYAVSDGICLGETYTLGTQTITTPGSYTETFQTAAGCDSTVNLTLTDLLPTSSTLNAEICQGETYQFESQTLTTAGNYTETIMNAVGCDSVINLTLVVNQPTSSSSALTLCANSYQFDGQNLTSSGTYTRTIPNSLGCDSIITLDLTLNAPLTVTTSLTGATLTATSTPAAASYQWFDCVTGTDVSGATSATFDPTVNGEYGVIATSADGCADTSACVVVNTVGVKDYVQILGLNLHPNPTNGVVTVFFENMDAEEYNLEVIDATGRKLSEQKIIDNTTKVDLSSYDNGVYMIRIFNETRESIHRIVKN
ncbi:T9SS type A sorting domain-containing protein [Brumimicrobium mesophilum]|uniref:T9SS type A sorting domain-containing protein n=1 Tax=Brumimicrobium mesophilum TaxID=392717 RepID=UPI000D144040|nr:T9SS type A sorting domain-containing protein [Brumimicrobium mesophilum]